MELTVTTMMSLDGVTQSPGAPEEDPSGGFELGGWAMPYFEEAAMKHVDEIFGRADAFLLGRKTYEIFASYWPGIGDDNAIAAALNSRPKHVVSSTLGDLTWDGASLLEGDLVEAVTALKHEPGRELQVHGSVELTQALLAAGLVDRHHLTVLPIVLRGGRGLFDGAVAPTKFRLEEAKTTPTGVQLLTLAPDGAVVQGHF
ncbi:MAG TPA: dihydrofolate reductase family protein [Solirubrobacterales bacterium]|jgi:dihydrofolate reductase